MPLPIRIIALLFPLLINCQLMGQQSDPHYIQYSVAEGLPSSEVYDLEIDSLNQLWISTDRGVSVYNGYEFKTYTTEDGLAGNCNFEIFKDSQNRLWFNGYNQTLSLFKNGIFSSYMYNSSIGEIASVYAGKWITDITESPNGHLYFAMYGPGLINCIWRGF